MAVNNNSQRFRPMVRCAECANPFGQYSSLQVRCADCNRGRKARQWRARQSKNPEWRKAQTARNKARLAANPERGAEYNACRRQKYVYAASRYANPLVCKGCGKTEVRNSGRQIVCTACAKIMGPLSARMRENIRQSLVRGTKNASWTKLVGYTTGDLRRHLERQFVKRMSWENFGDWHIDHIVPISHFAFSSADDDQFKQCWSLANLRPLWARANISKGARRELLL